MSVPWHFWTWWKAGICTDLQISDQHLDVCLLDSSVFQVELPVLKGTSMGLFLMSSALLNMFHVSADSAIASSTAGRCESGEEVLRYLCQWYFHCIYGGCYGLGDKLFECELIGQVNQHVIVFVCGVDCDR